MSESYFIRGLSSTELPHHLDKHVQILLVDAAVIVKIK